MKWSIAKKSSQISGGIDILLQPENDVVRFSILQFKRFDLPKLMYKSSCSISTGVEHVTIYNFRDMDWEDKTWAKNVKGSELETGELFLVHDVMGETVIKESLFDEILYDYGIKLFEVYQDDKTLPDTWVGDMQEALGKLKLKIDNHKLLL